jgi:transcriptional regulator of NAD metabolism
MPSGNIAAATASINTEKTTIMVTIPNPKSHPKGKTTNLKKPPPKPPPNSEKPLLSQESTTQTKTAQTTMSQETTTNTTRTTQQNSNTVYKTFDGTAGDKKGMLRNAIHAITSTAKNPFVKTLTSTNMRKKMNQRLMNEDRTAEELRHDLKRITKPKHVHRIATNPSSLGYSTEFLNALNKPKNIKDDASPNLLDDHNYDSKETELGTEAAETPLASNTTPSNFLPKKIKRTAFDDYTQEPDEDLDDDSLATANNVPFQKATQDFERTLKKTISDNF